MMTTLAPSFAIASAIAKPMPRAPPVTIAAFPSNFMIMTPVRCRAMRVVSVVRQHDGAMRRKVAARTVDEAQFDILELPRAGFAAQLIDRLQQCEHAVAAG